MTRFITIKEKIIFSNVYYTITGENFLYENNEKDKKYLFMIMNRPSDSSQRKLIRNTWFNKEKIKRNDYIYRFYIGSKNLSKKLLDEMNNENNTFNDIILLDHEENYYSLTNKTLLALNYTIKSYPNMKYYIKIDDDYMVFVDYILNELDKIQADYYGKIIVNAEVIRKNNSKFFVNFNDYNMKHYDPYADGPCYVVSGLAIRKILNNLHGVKIFNNEDAFIGYMAKKLKINTINDNRFSVNLNFERRIFNFKFVYPLAFGFHNAKVSLLNMDIIKFFDKYNKTTMNPYWKF